MFTSQTVVREILDLTSLANALGRRGESKEVFPRSFRHVVTGQGQRVTAATSDQRLALFTVPQGDTAYVVTSLSVRCFFNDVVANREPWPFFEIDQRGYGSLRFRVNGAFQSRPDTNYLLLANHACLFVFNPGDEVELIMNRSDNASGFAGYPANVNIAFRMNGYMTTPASVAQRFKAVETRLITVPANVLQL